MRFRIGLGRRIGAGIALAAAVPLTAPGAWASGDFRTAPSSRWSITASAAGPVLLTPCGEPFFSLGVNGIDGGPAVRARFNHVEGLRYDADGNLVLADLENHRIRLIDRLGSVITIAGTDDYFADSPDGGLGTHTPIACPADLAVHPDGRVYIADIRASRIRILTREPF